MKNFPMLLRMDGRRVVLCGGGEEVARKARLILKAEARITFLAPGAGRRTCRARDIRTRRSSRGAP